MLEKALQLQAGLKAWHASDRHVEKSVLQRAFRNSWDSRIGAAKFGGVWSISMARKNTHHPASRGALRIGRGNWCGQTVTVDHAIPVNVLFDLFWKAETAVDMMAVIDAYAVAVITREENERLNAAGLRSRMPHGWKPGDEPLARWIAAGIEFAER